MDTTIKKLSSNESGTIKKVKKIIWIILFALIASLVIYYFVCSITYSKGTRSGILTKVSEKGFVFKTFEGELNIGGISQGYGTIMPSSIFKFSVTDPLVYNQLEKSQGKKIVLHYKERIKTFFWQGESNYFIYLVTTVE